MLGWNSIAVQALTLLLSAASGDSRALVSFQADDTNSTAAALDVLASKRSSLVRRDGDPTDFAWVSRLVAIGDSYTAGIGSGNQLGHFGGGVPVESKKRDDVDPTEEAQAFACSRYDYAYPMLVNQMIGSGVEDFQYLACSGDRSVQIYDQVSKMNSDTNLLIMTAGGNDLCLASMIKKCVIRAFNGENTCDEVIKKAQENIDTILKPNLKQILLAVDGKMATDGIVVYNGYARFFNTDKDNCDKQNWSVAKFLSVHWFTTPLALTIARRQRFNDFVTQINKAIRDVIDDVRDEVKYTIGFADWDLWPIEVKGQMCDPDAKGYYPDPDQPDLQFFKPDTHVYQAPAYHDELKRTTVASTILGVNDRGVDVSIYDSVLWKSPNPEAEVLHKLDKRAPAPPNCPGDSDWFDPTLGMGMPDSFGKWFHPNELGHETIASFAVERAIQLRGKVLGVAESCELLDEFKCWKKEGRKGYATADRLNENYKDFCDKVEVPKDTTGWTRERTYFEGTPDEHTFVVTVSDDTRDWSSVDACKESMERIINSCDGNDPENPLDWKSGGRWRRDQITYELNIKRDNRPWPPIKEPYGSCHGQYYGFHSGYELHGAGFASWDHGQDTILPCMKGCLGLGITAWDLKYFDEPDSDGMEWKLTYTTPIWVQARCFNNNKVVQCAGGFTDGCSGTG